MRAYLLILIFLSFSCAGTDAEISELERPNILWITCEDISPNLGVYGDKYAYTPNLDQLASEGVLYTKAFATAPVCAVARSSIIAGMYSSSMGTQHMRCRGRRPAGTFLYPELLRQAGYFCTNNAKTDYNLDMDDKSIWDESSRKAHWRNRSDKSQPFFSIFNLGTSHESRVNGLENYQKAIAGLDPDLLKKPGEVPLLPYYPDTEDVRELWVRYYNIITAMDHQVGELLQELEDDRLADNTIVIFYSDHGAGIPRHKRWMYDTGLQVPWIVRVPDKYKTWINQEPGSKTDELVSFIDLAPTALHLAGVDIPTHMEGRAFLGKELTAEREYIYAGRDRMDERYDMQRVVRDKQFKYIRYYEPYKSFCQYMNTPEKGAIMQSIREAQRNGTLPEAGKYMVAAKKPQEELFDCDNDPYELHNLANDPAYAEKLEELRAEHARWSDETRDTGLIPETILREWEKNKDASIYDIMRNEAIPVTKIRETALAEVDLSTLSQNLSHENEAVRYWAAISLGNQASKLSSDKALTKALKDPVPVVRFAAARALAFLNQVPIALEVLEAGLEHENEWVRLNAAQVLDEMGSTAQPAITALQGVLDDQNKYVVRVANHALNQLQGTQNVVR